MADGRKKNGGKRANAGRKSKAEEMELAALLDECFTLNDRKKLIRALVKEANNSSTPNLEAAKLLLAYTFGKPVEKKEITGKDGADLKLELILNA